jgi:ribosomal protein S18 acetylase RimI-like enzyme
LRIKYRQMNLRDYPLLIELWKNTPGIGISSSDRKNKIRLFLNKNRKTCFVALKDREIVGTVLCGSDGRRGYIYHLVVKKEYRNKGIATRLIDYCLDGLKRNKIDKCHLFVYKTNVGAIDYYIRKKWKQRDELLIFSKNL